MEVGMKRVSILLLILFTSLATATAWAGSRIVYVPAPNGTDDTAKIQAALDACVAYGPGCTVQLAQGTYLTSQLVTYNFQGIFKGMGQTRTTIQALRNLPVSIGDPFTQGECKPDTTDCVWPSLIIFVDGDITVSDLTVNEPNVPATQPWLGGAATFLNDGIRFMGQKRTNVAVKRVQIKGAVDNSPTSCPDFNLCNAVIFAGEFPRSQTPFDYYFLSGAFSLFNSFFSYVNTGVAADGFLKDSRVVIGGSSSTGNVFKHVDVGSFVGTAQNSFADISYNKLSASRSWTAIFIFPWISDVFTPREPSLYVVHDNDLTPIGSCTNGVFMQDDPNDQELYAMVYNNTIHGQGICPIDFGFMRGTTIANNNIVGTGPFAIGVEDDTYAKVLGNDVSGFTADPSLAQIVLDGTLLEGTPTDTSDSTAVCRTPSDTVMNFGSNNTIIGCQQVSTDETQRSRMTTPKVLKKTRLFP
jgi:hypothetical protein